MRALVSVAFGLAPLLVGCSHPRAHIDYPDRNDEVVVLARALPAKSLGEVQWSEGGAIWEDCTKAAEHALKGLIAEAKARGANAIGNVRWSSTGSATPGCEKRWVFVNPTPLFLFAATPVFMSASVEGTAYRIEKPL